MKAEQGSLCQREKLKGKKSEGERLCEKGLWGVSEALVSPQRLWENVETHACTQQVSDFSPGTVCTFTGGVMEYWGCKDLREAPTHCTCFYILMAEETWSGRGGQHQMLRCIVRERINDRSAVERSSGGILAFEEEWNITLGGIVAGLLQAESTVFRALAAVLKAQEARDCIFL